MDYSCMPYLPIPPPHPSWTHLPPPPPPPPWFCPCVLYNSCCMKSNFKKLRITRSLLDERKGCWVSVRECYGILSCLPSSNQQLSDSHGMAILLVPNGAYRLVLKELPFSVWPAWLLPKGSVQTLDFVLSSHHKLISRLKWTPGQLVFPIFFLLW